MVSPRIYHRNNEKDGRDFLFFFRKKKGHVSPCTKSSSATVPGHPPFEIIVIDGSAKRGIVIT